MKKIFKLILLLLLISVAGKAQIKLVGNITTNGVASYPTHIDSLGKGGYMTIPTIIERDNIPTLRRKYGMLVFVQANDSLYKLSSINLDNSNWVTMGFASVLKLSNDSLLVYAKIKADSTTLAGRITSLGNSVANDIANAISSSSGDLAAEITRATAAENALSARVTTNTTNIASNSSSITNLTTILNAATDVNTPNTIVKRDANGNFSAGIITASLAGNSSTTTKLAASKTIYGNAFDGTADLTQAIAGTYGGTGINNGGKTITIGGNILTASDFTTSGNYSTTLTSTGVTNITLPTTGTIATLAGTETLTNKTIVDVALTGIPTAPTAAAGTSTTQVATTAFVNSIASTLGSRIDVNTTNINSNMISIGTNATNIAANTSAINNRVSFSDMPTFLLPYLKVADTTAMLSNYRTSMVDNDYKIAALITDTASLIPRFSFKENLDNKSTDVNADGTSNTKYPTVKSVKDYVDATITAATPDASPTVKGKIQLSGDLSGIAASPTVNTVGGSSSSTIHTAEVLANAATDVNTPNTIVKRDANGNFSAGIITASLAGNSSTTTKLAASKTIYGNAFDGTADLTQAIAGTYGGTGINNGGRTITIGGNILTASDFTTSGNYSTTLTSTGVTNITLPTTGTIATLAGTETLTNKTIVDVALTGIPTAPTAAAGTSTTQVATTAFVNATTSAATPDASPTVKGKIQLSGDLGGIATSPTVNTVGGSSSSTIHTAELLANAATDVNTPNTIVKRDANGNFSAGIITGSLNGNATTSTLAGNITATSNSTLTSLSNLNTVGTITSGVWSATTIDVAHGGTGVTTTSQNYIFAGPISGAGAPSFRALTSADVPAGSGNYIFNSSSQQSNSNFNISGNGVVGSSLSAGTLSLTTALASSSGGTGINNGTKTITLGGNILTGGNFSIIGSSPLVFRTSGSSDLTLPTSGTLATLSDISGSTIGGAQITGVILPVNGGTGIANAQTNTITLGGPLVTTGSGAITLNSSSSGSTITLPTTGTIATLAGTETLTNKTIVDVALTGVPTAPTATAGSSTTQIATTAFVTATTTAATPDASNTVKGKIQLSGDLGGNATSPTVNTVGGSSSSTIHTAELLANAATDVNTPSTIVKRDGSGNFSAGIITANLTGNASTATLAGNITATSNTTLTSLANLNTVGTITSGVWSATTIDVAHGGTGATTTSQNFVFAGPTTGAGAPTFRALTSADVPAGSGSYIANGTNQQASSNFNISGNGVVGTSLTAGSLTLTSALSVPNGGTGIATAPSSGQIDIGTTGGTFSRTTITAGTGVSIANGSGSITISATGSGGTVTNVNALTIGATGTDVTSTVANSTTTPTITLNIPSASATARGLITTGAQTIAGAKTFSGNLIVNGLTVGAGPNSTITTNTVLGKDALVNSSTSDYNTAIGWRALNSNGANAFGNTAVGANAINLNTTGEKNTAVGESAMTKNTTGNSNTAVGEYASRDNSIGSDNTSVGNFALAANTGSKNTAIGSGANTTSTTLENTTAIGYGSTVSASNTVQLGNADVTNVKTSGAITAGAVTYPKVDGTSGQVLVTDGSGIATFRTIEGAGANLTNGKILVGNASNVATAVNITGDLTLTNAGVASITARAVTYDKIQNVSATNKVLGRTTAGAGPVEEISMSGSGNVSRDIAATTEAGTVTLSDANSGQILYTQNAGRPIFPESLSDGFNCTIVNYSNSPATSNTLTSAKFFTNNTGNAGTTSFTIPSGGSVNIYAIKTSGAQRYYINYGDASPIAGTGITNSAGTFNINTSQSISALTNLTTNGIVTTSGGNGALAVVGSLPVTQGGTGLTTLGTNGQILTSNGTNMVWAPNSSASLSGGVAGAIPFQSAVGVTGYTAAGTAGQILTSAGTGTPAWITSVPVANGGTGSTTLTSNAVLLGNGTNALLAVSPGNSGNILTSDGTTWTSVAASSSGVTSLGNISATSNAKGATISGTTLTLTAADGTNGGVVTTAAQTFAGTKTFSGLSVTGAINGSSTVSSTISGFNAAITLVTTALTISSANAATYNGKVLVCSGSSFTVTFDSTVPVGFSCMILQSDNNTVGFSGTNNRYNYSATSGIYAIATAMCYASGSVLLTGDLQ